MVVSKSDYEECRKQRLEENKKRMEQLNLNQLSQALRAASTPKISSIKQAKPRVRRPLTEFFPVRRSSRVAENPQPNYKEMGIEPIEKHVRRGCYKRKDLLNRIYASDEARMYAIDRAENVLSDLESDFPSFLKPMLQSHVTGGFWLGLPHHFCKAHLPKHDEMMTLVDEDGNESLTKYLAEKSGLSGGWRGFAIDHELVDGDALVFQLITPTKFMVYIIRVDRSENDDNEEDDDNEEVGDKNEDVAKEADAEETTDAEQPKSSAKRIRKSKRLNLT